MITETLRRVPLFGHTPKGKANGVPTVATNPAVHQPPGHN